MSYRTEYLKIHERAYERLRSEGKTSWSESDDLSERLTFYQNVLLEMNLKTGARLLILGCGDGETSLALAEADYDVTGVDVSPTAIGWAREKASQRKIAISFVEENLASGSFPLGQFDAIIDDHCLHCIIGRDRTRVLNRVFSMLKSQGVLIVRTHCGDPPPTASPEVLNTWDPDSRCQVHDGVAGRYFGRPEDILRELEEARLTIVRHRIFHYPNGWGMLEAIARKDG